jgi:hypothetical protein
LLLVSLFFCFIIYIYMSIYLASDLVRGDRREDRAFALLLSAVPIICGLVKQKIKDKGRERGRTNDPTRKQIIIIVLITHAHSDWVTKKPLICPSGSTVSLAHLLISSRCRSSSNREIREHD